MKIKSPWERGLQAASTFVVLAALLFTIGASAASYVPSATEPPWVKREFRGVWVATIGHVDWPSDAGLPVDQQKADLRRILDTAVRLNLNAVIFQVRPCGDALYDSQIEPWSSYLTGTMGRAPSPYYDPLAFAIEEAHKRGLELHAWFSPYRASHPSVKSPAAPNHVSRTHPGWIRPYGDLLWLDPGLKDVQDYTVRVIMDVVNRYDIDGVHFDDRLGYPEPDPKHKIEFPDAATYKLYTTQGGRLPKDDWRRENVNSFVQTVYQAVKAAKPWVKVGIAPAGVWQNGVPPQIKGGSTYSLLYTDSRKWLMNGWLDYCSPQLYWPMDQPPLPSFPVLLNWWREQNLQHRNLWPGLDAGKFSGQGETDQILAEVQTTRDKLDGAAGAILYSASCLVADRGRIVEQLLNSLYAQSALIPASSWLEQGFPAKPDLRVENGRAVWEPAAATDKISAWLWQTRTDGQWQTRILPRDARGITLPGSPDAVAVTAIDRCGVASPAAVLQRESVARK